VAADGRCRFEVSLPMPSVSLIEIVRSGE